MYNSGLLVSMRMARSGDLEFPEPERGFPFLKVPFLLR